jgi:hypothetical protein
LNLAFCCPVDCPLRFYRRNKKTLFINYPLSAADPMGSGQAPPAFTIDNGFYRELITGMRPVFTETNPQGFP